MEEPILARVPKRTLSIIVQANCVTDIAAVKLNSAILRHTACDLSHCYSMQISAFLVSVPSKSRFAATFVIGLGPPCL